MSLYLKYRPRTIDELDLAGVRKTLNDIAASNKLGHAYLFTGPRGAGKTSSARILARLANCEKNGTKLGEPCNTCDACISILTGSAVDVVEIDAASNRGIDDIRELKEKIRLAPSILRRKVYIIDEVHMLTTEAFNALLKTLEEPPEHAIFILCTTESHKVPETIASRCVRVSFTKATPEEMKRSFARVINGEMAEIDEEALDTLAKAVDGSFRDGVKLLDSAIALGTRISLADVESLLYGAAGFKSQSLSKAIINRDLAKALEAFRNAVNAGIDLTHLTVSVMKDLREEVLSKTDKTLIPMIYKLDDCARKITLSPVPELLLEMVIVEWCGENKPVPSPPERGPEDNRKVVVKTETVVTKITEPKQETSPSERISQVTPEKSEAREMAAAEQADPEVSGRMINISAEDAWNRLISNLNGESYSLGALLSKARPGNIQGNLLTIQFAHAFHKEQLMQAKFRERVEKLISDIVGTPMRVAGEVVSGLKLQTAPQTDTIAEVNPEENELLEAAEEIFG